MKKKKLKPYRPRQKISPPKVEPHAKMYDRKKAKITKKKDLNETD